MTNQVDAVLVDIVHCIQQYTNKVKWTQENIIHRIMLVLILTMVVVYVIMPCTSLCGCPPKTLTFSPSTHPHPCHYIKSI